MGQSNTIIAAQVITASGNEPGGHTDLGDSLSILVDATAVSGTSPSATFSVLWSDDGIIYAPATPADVFTAITAAGSTVQRFTTKGQFFQIAWAVTGTTPSFTTTVSTFS